MNTKTTLIGAALLGLVATGCSSTSGGGAKVLGECHGINSCKGSGDCGGKGHGCAGKNSCKGNGWKKLSKSECKEKGGKFKR